MKSIKNLLILLIAAALLFAVPGCELVTTETTSTLVKNSSKKASSEDTAENSGDSEGDNTESGGGNNSGGASGTGSKISGNKTSGGNTGNKSGSTKSTAGNNSTGTISVAPGEKNTEGKRSGKLELQIFTNDTQSSGEAWTEIIDNFEDLTKVKVTAVIGSDANSKMTKRWMAGNPPDMAYFSGTGIPDVALEKAGDLYECTDMLNTGYVYGTDDKIKDVVISDLHEKSSGSKIYRPGFLGCTNGILYDTNYIKTLGVSIPANSKELTSFVKALGAKGKYAFTTNGNGGHYPLWSMVMPAVGAYSQDLLDKICKGNDVAAIQSAEFKSVLQRWYDFCASQNAILSGTPTFDHTTSQLKWLNHESVLIGNGIWLPDEMRNNTPPGFDMAYSASPLVLEGQKPCVVVSPSCFIIATKAKNLENAKAFMRFLYRKDSQEILVSKFAWLGIRKDMDYTKVTGMTSAQKAMLTYIYSDKVQIRYRRYQWLSMNDHFNRICNELMTDQITVDQAIKFLVAEAKKL